MENKKRVLLVFVLLTVFMQLTAFSQDTLRVMQYNLFRYGESGKEPSFKNPLLNTIVTYVQPDVLGVNEVSATADYAQNILTGALNINGVTSWRRGALSKAGVDKSLTNTIFYNSNKLKLLSQDTVSTVQREITGFNFMYVDSNSVKTGDTIFFTVLVLHFKAGNTSSDEATRGNEAIQIVNYINAFGKSKNIMVMGDYNVYTNTEAAFYQLTTNTDSLNKLKDPLNKVGTWNNNSAYQNIHTQSTHTTQTGGFSSGGMDDRFDIMLCSKSLISDSANMRILPSTYIPVGNDGQHFNLAINAAPTNTSVPTDVLGALYNMSDHIPIRADFVFTPKKPLPQSVSQELKNFENQIYLQNPISNELNIHVSAALLSKNISFELFDINAKRLLKFNHLFTENDLHYTLPFDMNQGVYILKIRNENGWVIQRKLLKK